MKRKISILLVLVMIFSAFAGCLTAYAEIDYSKPITSYVDVPEEHWAYPWVTYMAERNYIHGYPVTENDGLHMYKPDQWITRAELASILYLVLKPQGEMTEEFSDLFDTDWYYKYFSKAVAAGYYSGYNDGTMRPNRYITREEASCVIYNAFKIEKSSNITNFLDKDDISSWAMEAIMSLADIGVMVGYTGATEDERYINPKTNIKRAEIASLLANADKFYPSTVTLSDGEIDFDSKTGGSIAFDMYPKNTSDYLCVKLTEATDIPFTVTYHLNGTTATVTPEEFEKLTFTAAELENLQVELNFDGVEEGSKAEVIVEVTDKGDPDTSEDDRLAGWGRYRITFKKGSQPIISGGSSTVYYKVTYDVDGDGNSANDPWENVASGSYPQSVPVPDGSNTYGAAGAYVWTGENDTIVNPKEVPITQATTFIARLDYDRVIISLQAYQAMKGQGRDVATVNTLTQAPYNNSTTGFDAGETDAHVGQHQGDNTWWTTDMLEIIVTNDKDHLSDSDKNYQDMSVTGATLYEIYDDVARYVVDNSTEFDLQITAANKLTYVKFFRAMVKTINDSAVYAAEAYWNVMADGKQSGDKAIAYNEFKQNAVLGAVSALDSALTAEQVDNDALGGVGGLALSYVADLYTKADDVPEVTLKAALETMYTAANGNLDAFKTAVAAYIAQNHIYP